MPGPSRVCEEGEKPSETYIVHGSKTCSEWEFARSSRTAAKVVPLARRTDDGKRGRRFANLIGFCDAGHEWGRPTWNLDMVERQGSNAAGIGGPSADVPAGPGGPAIYLWTDLDAWCRCL